MVVGVQKLACVSASNEDVWRSFHVGNRKDVSCMRELNSREGEELEWRGAPVVDWACAALYDKVHA